MVKSKFINPLFRPTEVAVSPEEAPATPASEPEVAQQTAPAVATVSGRSLPRRRAEPEVAPTEAPVKFTFYFSPEQLRRLDDLWVRAKLDHKQRLNKSEFVRLALDRLLDEFEKSPLAVLNALRRQRS